MALSNDDLVGGWTLEEMYAEADDGSRTHTMGRDAGGMIMYTPDGYMSAIIHFSDRFLTADRPSDKERSEAFATYFNYAGTWAIEGDTVTHTIQHALDPNMVGVSLSRQVEHEGARMVFSGMGPDSGTKNVIIWKRQD